jgi:hypothetical protein
MTDRTHMLRIPILLRCAALLACAAAILSAPVLAQPPQDIAKRFPSSLTEVPKGSLPVKGSIYVPAYSSVSLSYGRARADFSVTLSIHNVSADRPLVLTRVAYFDTSGSLVQNFMTAPVALKPFATVHVFIPVTDIRGGTGANFAVDWAAEGRIAEPTVEALMLGTMGNASYSFISQGRPISKVGAD